MSIPNMTKADKEFLKRTNEIMSRLRDNPSTELLVDFSELSKEMHEFYESCVWFRSARRLINYEEAKYCLGLSDRSVWLRNQTTRGRIPHYRVASEIRYYLPELLAYFRAVGMDDPDAKQKRLDIFNYYYPTMKQDMRKAVEKEHETGIKLPDSPLGRHDAGFGSLKSE